ncbi:MAG: sugar-binding protein [Candidatus Desantisbacteria bacterium]
MNQQRIIWCFSLILICVSNTSIVEATVSNVPKNEVIAQIKQFVPEGWEIEVDAFLNNSIVKANIDRDAEEEIIAIIQKKGYDRMDYKDFRLMVINRNNKETICKFKDLEQVGPWTNYFNAQDLNNDGKAEIIVEIHSGGQGRFTDLFIYTWEGNYKKIFTKDTVGGFYVIDINKDGVYEIVINSREESERFCGGSALYWQDVYKWNGTTYIHANESFPEHYDDLIEEYMYDAESEPLDPLPHCCLGRIYEIKRIYPKAIAEYKKALKLNINNEYSKETVEQFVTERVEKLTRKGYTYFLQFKALKTKRKIIIGGKLNEWQRVSEVILEEKQYITYKPDNWQGKEDLSTKIMAQRDDENLYLALKVTDDKFVQQFSGDKMLKGDHVELWFGTERGTYQFGLSPGNFNNLKPEAVLWMPNVSSDDKQKILKGVMVGSQKTETGYNMEVKIPLANIGVTKETYSVKFTLVVSDTDDAANPGQDSLLASSKLKWNKPETFGELVVK